MKLLRGSAAANAITHWGQLKPGECAWGNSGAALWMRVPVGCYAKLLGCADDAIVGKDITIAMVSLARTDGVPCTPTIQTPGVFYAYQDPTKIQVVIEA